MVRMNIGISHSVTKIMKKLMPIPRSSSAVPPDMRFMNAAPSDRTRSMNTWKSNFSAMESTS